MAPMPRTCSPPPLPPPAIPPPPLLLDTPSIRTRHPQFSVGEEAASCSRPPVESTMPLYQRNPRFVDLKIWKPPKFSFAPGRMTPVVTWYTPGISEELFTQRSQVSPGITKATLNPGLVETTRNGRYARLRRDGYCKHEGGDVRSVESGAGGGEMKQLEGGDFSRVVIPRGEAWAQVGGDGLPRLPGWEFHGYVVLCGNGSVWSGPQVAAGEQYVGLRGADGVPAGISQIVRKHAIGGFYSLQLNVAQRIQADRQPRLQITIAGEEYEVDLDDGVEGQFQHKVISYQAKVSEDVEVKIENIGDGTVFIDAIRIQSDEDYFRIFCRGSFIRDLAWQLVMSMVMGMDLYNNVTFVQKWDWENSSFFFAAVLSTLLQLKVSSELARAEIERTKPEVCAFEEREAQNCGNDTSGSFGSSAAGAEDASAESDKALPAKGCRANLNAWCAMKYDWLATWSAHTVCFFLQVPHVLTEIVPRLHPVQQSMGKSSAKVLGARVFACTWQSNLHFVCDNEFGSHMFLPWNCVSKVFVFILQFLLWSQREDARGTAQLCLKAALIFWSARQLRRVMTNRMMLQNNMRQELRESQITGVAVDPQGRSGGTWLQPSEWLNIKPTEDAAIAPNALMPIAEESNRTEWSECDRERCERVDAVYNGIFRKHFCWTAQPSKTEQREFRVEDYIGWRGGWKSLWGTNWMDTLVRVVLMLCLLAVFYQHIRRHPFRGVTPQPSPAVGGGESAAAQAFEAFFV